MSIKVRVSAVEQKEAIIYISQTAELYKDMLKDYRNRMLDVYQEYSTFKQPKLADWKTTFKVNKAHEVVNKITPRIMSKTPSWIVSFKPDVLNEVNRLDNVEERMARVEQLKTMSVAVQDYLSHIFDKYNLIEPARLWAKNMIIYGNSFAKIRFKYEMASTAKPTNKEEVYIDPETWEEIVEKKEKEIEEYVRWEYPTIEVKSWADILYDPRYKTFEEVPAIIETTNWVRLAELKRNKDKYINLDKIDQIPSLSAFAQDPDSYRKQLMALTGIDCSWTAQGIDKNALSLKTFHWLYAIGDKEERMYKITTVNDLFVICFEEISQNPFEMIRCFEDTETLLSWGFVEPIIWLQQELNFKKNSASEYVNQALNRSFVRNPNSWINPRDLVSKPWNVIPTSRSIEDVQANLFEIPMRTLTSDYFQEQNDFERQIQAVTFTVDTSNPQNQQALTNTATGARIKFFESNIVIDDKRKAFERGLKRLAYKLLNETYENMEENIVIKKQGDEWYWEINKELLRNAIQKYEIRVEIGSSSYETIEDRREDAIAKYNLWLQAKKTGVPVDLTKLFSKIMETFEDNEDYVENIEQQQMMQQLMGGQQGGGSPLPQPEKAPSEASQLTEAVAQWWVTAWV